MTSDPFLDAHSYTMALPGGETAVRYALNRPTPISVRDQILRGTNLSRRMAENGIIGPGRCLVVIGAGAGGSSAAIEAARLGVTSYLVDSVKVPFSLQARAPTRYVDPTGYDWPVDHCQQGRLPGRGQSALPLSTVAGSANSVALAWRAQLRQAARKLAPNLKVRQPASVNRVVPLKGGMQGVELSTGDRLLTGAVLDAFGFGNEDTRIVTANGKVPYEGMAFWSRDDFGKLSAGSHKILISGAGDGALQDYLRIVTRLSSALEAANKCRIPSTVLHAVQSAEDRANRGLAWVGEGSVHQAAHELPFVREREERVAALARASLGLSDVRAGLDELFAAPAADVSIVYPTEYLTCYYGLNRFLTLLFTGYLDERSGRRTLYPGCLIASIAPAASDPHTCMDGGSPPRASGKRDADGHLVTHECFGRMHTVTFAGNGPKQHLFNVVIVRHGMIAPPQVPLARPRHLLPYYQP